MDVDGHDGPPPRGWSMKKGHRKRLEAACGRKARKGRAPEVSLGRSVAKRSVNVQSRWHMDEWYKPRTRRNLRQSMLEAVGEAEEMYGLYVMDSDEQYVDYAPYVTFNAFQDGACEAKCTDDVEVASVCTSTTAGSDSPSISAVSSTISAASASALALSLCLSPWKAALLRAELVAERFARELASNRLTAKQGASLPQPKEKTLDEQFLHELGKEYGASVAYDPASLLVSAEPFEQLRWKFLKDYGRSFCSSLSSLYSTVGRSWSLKPTPLDGAVRTRFQNACASASEGDLQPALHGTNASKLSSIYSRGLLIPGANNNDVRVANGSVHGVGIYTAYVSNASLSWSYARGSSRPVLVCGVLDPTHGAPMETPGHVRKGEILYTGPARIFFDETLVAPLFEATCQGAFEPGAMPIKVPVQAYRKKNTVLPVVETRRRGPGPRTRLSRFPPPRSVPDFLTRRAARRRRA